MKLSPRDQLVFGACIALTGLLAMQGAELVTPATPHAIVSFEFAATPERARVMLAAWEAVGQLTTARWNTYIDMFYLISYPLAIARLVTLCGGWRLMQRAILLAAPLDLIENILMLRAMAGHVDEGVTVAAVCAAIKFTLVGAGLIAALVGWLTRRRRSAAHPPAA